MSTARKIEYLSVSEYLKSEKSSETRHEYVDGDIFEMAGESRRHNLIASNCLLLFRNHLENTNCETYFEGVNLRANPTTYYYPDVVVTCDTDNETNQYVIQFPCLIVEVLSPSTAATDKREKLIAYKLISSLQEYVIIWQNEMRIELHRRQSKQKWLTLFFTKPDDKVFFASINLSTTLAEIYQKVTFAK